MCDVPTRNARGSVLYDDGDFGEQLMTWNRWVIFKGVQFEFNGYRYGGTGDLPEFRWDEMSLITVGIEAHTGCIKKGPQFYPHWK